MKCTMFNALEIKIADRSEMKMTYGDWWLVIWMIFSDGFIDWIQLFNECMIEWKEFAQCAKEYPTEYHFIQFSTHTTAQCPSVRK